jgi:hypothetical protein
MSGLHGKASRPSLVVVGLPSSTRLHVESDVADTGCPQIIPGMKLALNRSTLDSPYGKKHGIRNSDTPRSR